MFQLTLDIALNLLWLSGGLCALLALAWCEWRGGRRKGRWLRLTAVAVTGLALFPAVSFSDDLFSYSLLQAGFGTRSGVGGAPPEDPQQKTSTLQLARLIESLDQFTVAAGSGFFVALLCVSLWFAATRQWLTRAAVCACGRAPPRR